MIPYHDRELLRYDMDQQILYRLQPCSLKAYGNIVCVFFLRGPCTTMIQIFFAMKLILRIFDRLQLSVKQPFAYSLVFH